MRFILLRAEGWSLSRIAAELNVSKPTLIKWSRQRQFDINNLRAMNTETLALKIFGERERRWEMLAKQLQRLEEEINKRDLAEIPASRLHDIAARLRAEIAREAGPIQLSEKTSNIPMSEYVIATETWQP